MGPELRRYRIGAHSCGDGVTKYKLFVCLVGFLFWEVKKTRTYILFTVQSIHTPPQMSSINHTFVQQIQNLINWIDADAIHMDKESILDGSACASWSWRRSLWRFPIVTTSASCPRPSSLPQAAPVVGWGQARHALSERATAAR